MRLLVAWVVSALACIVAYLLAAVIVVAISEVYRWGRLSDPNFIVSLLRVLPTSVYLSIFGVLLVLQLAYGGLVYFVLRKLGRFNLTLVLVAYLVPIAGLALKGTAAPQIANSIPLLSGGVALAVVGWFLARPAES